MKLFAKILTLCCLASGKAILLAETATSPAQETVSETELAQSAKVALDWLSLLDKGQYGESWERGSKLFQLTMTKDDWEKMMKALRNPLGAVSLRKMADQRVALNPAGLPAGQYMAILYDTTFSSKTSHELLTLMREDDGQWRVLTYLVQ